jgi:hypothetical protein
VAWEAARTQIFTLQGILKDDNETDNLHIYISFWTLELQQPDKRKKP